MIVAVNAIYAIATPNCWELLANNVASVCAGLNAPKISGNPPLTWLAILSMK